MRKRNFICVSLLTAVIIGTAGHSIAHSGATGIVKERMEGMKTLAEHAKNIGDMLKRKTSFDLSAVASASSAFISHGEQIPMLFPDTKASRQGSNTEALPAIWNNWEDFTGLAEQFTEDSQTLLSLVEELNLSALSDDEQRRAVRVPFITLSKNCSGCHEQFRQEKN